MIFRAEEEAGAMTSNIQEEIIAVLDNVVGVNTGRGLGHTYVLKIKRAAFVDGWVESVRERKGQE